MRAPLLLAPVLLLAGAASAHPQLAEALVAEEGAVTLRFTEALESAFLLVEVRDPEGRALSRDVERPPLAPQDVVVRVEGLAPGGYVVAWRVLGLDGHVSQGERAFVVGDAAPSRVAVPPPPASSSEGAARGALLAGLLALAGVPPMLRVVDADAAASRRASRLLLGAGALAVLGAATLPFLLAARLGAGLGATLATVPGGILAAQAAASLVALGLAARALVRPSAPLRAVAWAGAAALAIHLGTSHALAQPEGSGVHAAHVHVPMLLAHVGAAAVWSGGVLALLLAAPGRDAQATAVAIRRFAPWAMGSVAILAATGAYQAWAALPDAASVLATPYGRLLALKTALLLALSALGALQQRRLAPRLARAAASPRAARRALVAEAVGMAALVLVVGALGATAQPPPSVPSDAATTAVRTDDGPAPRGVVPSPSGVAADG